MKVFVPNDSGNNYVESGCQSFFISLLPSEAIRPILKRPNSLDTIRDMFGIILDNFLVPMNYGNKAFRGNEEQFSNQN